MFTSVLFTLSACLLLGDDDLGEPQDVDGDGFAAPQDCDDSDADVNPDAQELSDTQLRDDDCDGLIDDAGDSAPTATWFQDQDLDTWGLDGAVVEACEPGAGWPIRAGDCDESPQCRPQGDELVTSVDDAYKLTLDDDGLISRRFGGAVAAVGDFDGDDLDDLAAGAVGVDDGVTDRQNGAVYVFSSSPVDGASATSGLVQLLIFGGTSALSGNLGTGDRIAALEGAEVGDQAGYLVAAAGDFDGEGLPDLAGNTYDLAGLGVRLAGTEDSSIGAGSGLDEALPAGIDQDEDGYADLLVGEPEGAEERGRALLFAGQASPPTELGAEEAADTLIGEAPGDLLGTQTHLALGLTGGGPTRVAAAPIAEDNGPTGGVIYVVGIAPDGATIDLAVDPAERLAAGSETFFSGLSIGDAGDLNGDGESDLAAYASTRTARTC